MGHLPIVGGTAYVGVERDDLLFAREDTFFQVVLKE
jgi:hypothetical protein